jgi:predicted NAD-dependent protein-ADP-ribosyltransferase YbiA (DUF1768 family)
MGGRIGVEWASFEGRRFPYRLPGRGEHYRLIAEAMRAKFEQNPELREVLLMTGDIVLRRGLR